MAVFDVALIRDATFVREIEYQPEMRSTNSRAVELARADCQTPLLVLTDRQTEGRGRGSHTWWSADGALTFTVLLDLPMLDPARIGPFSLTAGLAVCQALEKFAPAADLALKWPNDVYLNEKKVSGILIQRPLASEPRLVIGVGINVNCSLADAPQEVQGRATSMRQELGFELPMTEVLVECLRQLERRTRDHVHQRGALLDQWRAYSLLSGRHVTVEHHGNQVSGVCQGINAEGALLVDDGQQTHACIAGEITRF